MLTPKDKFQQLLRELFQFDCADLDFGIYRIMNIKREAIEKFIQNDLMETVDKELSKGVLAGQTKTAEELEKTAKQIRQSFGDNALDSNGVLVDAFENTPLGKKYTVLKSQAAGTQTKAALETDIYNHLYAFFNRYYDTGDFLSKRRYGRKEKYAIPYNGEEVYLYWANSDQYYIKTGEYFNNYQYKTALGVTVHFKLVVVDVEKDNIKGDKRFFIPVVADVTYNEKDKEILIPFQYRPLTEAEGIKYGQRNQQDIIISEALETIPAKLREYPDTIGALQNAYHTDKDGKPVNLLEHHLILYTQRNTSDFFIHKDLKGFLTSELDFYLKNEVLNIDELGVAGQVQTEGWFQVMSVIKAISRRIIEFLAQIENLQKKLFEKKKFITETQYCITMSSIPETFYAEIADCETQWKEWEYLYHINEEKKDLFTVSHKSKKDRAEFLKAHPTLVLDTKYFNPDFNDRLLSSFKDLDEMTDGLLIHAENFQALNLLSEKYREKIKGIYIDPPYNTNASEIIYKNDYKHSSWLSFLYDRALLGKKFLSGNGLQCTTIDETEFHRLREIIGKLFGEENIAGVVTIKSNPSGRSTVKGFSIADEYAIFSFSTNAAAVGMLPRTQEQLAQYGETDSLGQFQWRNFMRAGGANDFRTARPKLHYPLLINKETVRIPEMKWNDVTGRWEITEKLNDTDQVILPISNGNEYTWRLGIETLRTRLNDLRVRQLKAGKYINEVKFRLGDEGVMPKTVWDDKYVNATAYGTTILRNLMGDSQTFSFPKSVYAVERSIQVCGVEEDDWVLDYFAGSGTTAHAVINLNREYGGNRKFILVEMNDYFHSVLMPRIKKVIFTPEWKDGKPVRQPTSQEIKYSPRIIKHINLESYEDALNNITFNEAPKTLYDFDDYLLKYMLDWETKRSATLLNVSKLASPFTYKLNIIVNQEKQEKVLDIPETFSYLLGLNVKTRRVFNDDGRRYLVYRGSIDHREIAVVWRDIAGWLDKDFQRDKEFVIANKLTEDADEIQVNGDSLIPNAHSLDGIFKSRMFGEL